jgi:colicin import membrane protein
VKQKKAAAHPIEKPPQPGRIRAVFLAVMVHAAFFALIVFGVAWQSRPDVPVIAELWDKLPPAPTAKTIEPEPKAEPKVEPPKPEPVKPPPKPPEEKPEPPKPDPAIAKKLEREKKDLEKKEKLERDKREKQKADEAKKKREQEDAAKRRKEEEKAKRDAEKAREEAAAARKSEIDGYVNAIKQKIRGRANVPDTVTGNPEVQVRIRVLPGGEVLDIAITKRSGNPTYDSAIERGIRSASPLPVPSADSELFPQFRDLTLNIRHER